MDEIERRPSLTLGEPPKGLKKKEGGVKALLGIILLIQLAILSVLIIFLTQNGSHSNSGPANATSVRDFKSVAMALEDRSLDREAAEAWERYLDENPLADNRSQILYRIGKLRMNDGAFDEAASAFVRAELDLGDDDKDLKAKIGPKMVECLRKLGRYGEVSRELTRRVQVGGTDEDGRKPLATFAGEALFEADLDRMIERRVDQVLTVQEASNESMRQTLLKQMRSPHMREQLLQELIQTELFSRRAREMKLDQEEDYLKAREYLEEGLLTSRFIRKTMEKIQPTDVDLEAHYTAFKEEYREPEAVDAVIIELGEEEEAAALLQAVSSAEDFLKLAEERMEGDEGAEPVPSEVVRGRYHAELGYETDSLFALDAGEWTASPIERNEARYLALVQKKIPARIPSLAEVEDRVLKDYTDRKQKEVFEKVIKDLMARYDVKILPPSDEPEEEDEEEEEGS